MRKIPILITASALALGLTVGTATLAQAPSASAAVPGPSLSKADSTEGYPEIKSWKSYTVPVNIQLPSGSRTYPAGALSLTLKMDGPISAVSIYPGWKVSLNPGSKELSFTNTEPVTVGPVSAFTALDVRGSFPRGGVAQLSLNEPGLTLISDLAPMIE